MKIVFLLEGSELTGGAKVVFDLSQELYKKGNEVYVVSREKRAFWHPLEGVKFIESSDFREIPEAEAGIATFWTTVIPAYESKKFKKLFHFCQGYEGSFPPYKNIKEQIDKAYSLPIPKILIAPYLKELLEKNFNARTYVLGQILDKKNFYPPAKKEFKKPYIFSVVGPFEIELKGVKDALKGLKILKEKFPIRVYRASTFFISKEEENLKVVDVYFHHLLPEEMGNFYRNCHFHIQASHKEEGFPLPALEAFACKTYPFVSDIPSYSSLPFIKFKEKNIEDMVEKISKFLEKEDFEKIFENYEEIIEEYSIEKVASKFEEIIKAEINSP